MFIAKRQSGWSVFGPGQKPLRTELSGEALINFIAQRQIRQSSLTKSSEEKNKGEKRQTKHTLQDRIKLIQISVQALRDLVREEEYRVSLKKGENANSKVTINHVKARAVRA